MKKIIKGILMCLLLVGIFKVNQISTYATTYYVSAQDGDNSNEGTLKNPIKTIQKALDIAKAGDKVYILSGIYNEQLTVKTSGTKNNPIIISNYNNSFPVVDGTNKSEKNQYGGIALLTIINKDYIEINGIEFKNLQTSTKNVVHGINVVGYGEGISIKNCKVHDIKTNNSTDNANGHGISIYGTNETKPILNLAIENNEVYNCKLGQSESVVLNGNVTDFIVRGNSIHDNDNIGIDFIGYEKTAGSGEQDRARNGICIDNNIYNISSKNNHAYHGDMSADGIYVDGGKNIIIERNRVKNCDIGIEAASEHKGKYTDNIIIRNNLITDCKGYTGICFGGASTSNGMATNIKIYNNTLYNCDTGVVIQNANSNTNAVKNNIIYKCGQTISGKIGKNIISNNYTSNPMFEDELNNNFRLLSNSMAIDKGVDVDFGKLDLDGNDRVYNDNVDMGCYEYNEEISITPEPIEEPEESPVPVEEPENKMEFIIDGLYNDWEKIDSIITQENSKLRELKLYKDDKYLYVCVIGNNLNKFQNTQLLINADNNTQTGYIATNHGIDYLIENGELFKYTKEKGVDWSFSRIGSIEGYKKTDTCIEYKIGLENINTLNNIIALKVRVLDKKWNIKYQIPKDDVVIY